MESNVDISFGNEKKAMEELSSGYECAKQLMYILQQHKTDTIGSSNKQIGSRSNQSTKDLLKKISESIDDTISILTTTKSTSSSSSSECNDVESDEVEFLPQSQSQSPVPKDAVCCHMRQSSSGKWTEESSMLADDGHAWRKYGQKQIRGGKYPRDYFRCTYKFDRHCKATKHVERIHGNPPKYRITYFGHHSCNKILTPPQILSSDVNVEDNDSSILLNFETSIIKCKKQKNFQIPLPIFPCPSPEHQCVKEDTQDSKLLIPSDFDMSPKDITTMLEGFDVPIMSPRMSMDFDINYMMVMNFEEDHQSGFS